jgi:hypothetical protein
MPRGRPPKNKTLDKNAKVVKITTKGALNPSQLDENGEPVVRQKRKYTRRATPVVNTGEDGTIINPEAKKRGRKRGRKKKNQDMLFKPEEVVDFIHRNYPLMGIDKIRDKIIEGMKIMKEFGENPYLLYKFTYNGQTYYNDDRGAILNADGRIVGYFVTQDDGTNKMYMIDREGKDTRTYDEVIKDIESGKFRPNSSTLNKNDNNEEDEDEEDNVEDDDVNDDSEEDECLPKTPISSH